MSQTPLSVDHPTTHDQQDDFANLIDMSRFKNPPSLDDFPDEILANIYKEYFIDKVIVFSHKNSQCPEHDIAAVYDPLLISRRHSSIAEAAMLEHGTVRAQSAQNIACMLTDCKTLDSICTVVFSAGYSPRTDSSFAMTDDLLRSLKGLKQIHVDLVVVTDIGDKTESSGGDLLEQVDSGAVWTRSILKEGLRTGLGRHDNASPWIADIVAGKAFAGSLRVPKVSLQVSVYSESKCWELRYSPVSQTLSGLVDGRVVEIKQDVPDHSESLSDSRAGRGWLCDGRSIDTTVESTLESIFGKPFDCKQRLTFVEGQAGSIIDRKDREELEAETIEYRVSQMVIQMYDFDLIDESCAKVVKWLEARQEACTLAFDTFEEIKSVFEHISGRPLTSYALEVVKRIVTERRSRGAMPGYCPRDLTELFRLVRPAVGSKTSDNHLWWVCYELLYVPDADNPPELYLKNS